MRSAVESGEGQLFHRSGISHQLRCLAEFSHLGYENTWEKFDRIVLSGMEPTHPRHIAYDGKFDDVAVYMEVVPREGISWAEYYLGVGLLGLGLSVAVAAGVPFLSGTLGTVLLAVVFVVIVASSSYHLSRQEGTMLDRLRE